MCKFLVIASLLVYVISGNAAEDSETKEVLELLEEANPGQFVSPEITKKNGLTLVDLSFHKDLKDISPLRKLKIDVLSLQATSVVDLKDLEGMTLVGLDLSDTKVRDLSAIRGMNLQYLSLASSNVENIEPLKGMKLRRLNLSDTNVKDISVLKTMPLEVLSIARTRVESLGPIRNAELIFLDASDSRVRSLKDANLSRLKTLYLSGLEIIDFEILKNSIIEDLTLPRSGVSRETLQGLKRLKKVDGIDSKKFFSFQD